MYSSIWQESVDVYVEGVVEFHTERSICICQRFDSVDRAVAIAVANTNEHTTNGWGNRTGYYILVVNWRPLNNIEQREDVSRVPFDIDFCWDTVVIIFSLQIQSARTLWSAHILCVRQELKDLMLTIGCTSNYILIALLTRLINLISALGPSTALMMAQNCLETIIEVWERACKDMASHNEYVQSLKSNESGEGLMEGTSTKDSNR